MGFVMTVLEDIQTKTNEALNAAIEAKVPGAYNAGDLSCRDVAVAQSLSQPRQHYQVFIEEAAPDCDKLHRFVEKYLEDKGYQGVQVFTEW